MEDEQIVELYLNRDESAVHHTAKKYGRRLRTLALGVVGDMQTAEECENDTYLEAWRSIPPHEPKRYLYAFLARITRHVALNRCRERDALKRGGFVSELTAELEQCVPASDDVERHLNAMALGETISRFLRSIDRTKRDMFLRRYWYLDSVSAIAQRFGCSEGKVKTTLFRVRGKLREYLEQEGYTV